MTEQLMNLEQLIAQFEANKGWDKQYRLIIQLGKKLPVLAEQDKNAQNQIHGCESLAWCIVEKKAHSYYFKLDSDTRVVRGLMAILQIIFNGKNLSQIEAIDTQKIFDSLGLINHLSPSRSSGLFAIVDKIKRVKEGYEEQ